MKKVNVLMAFALVAMMAAAFIGGGHSYAQSATTSVTANDQPAGATSSSLQASTFMPPSVTANDQPAGATLTVAKVVAAYDGWITVHANTAANQPGDQLGHTAVKAGENDNVVVNLSPTPAAGDKVWPMLHIDAGVIGTYEFPGPDAPVIINGNIVMKQITLTAAMPAMTPSVEADDQPAGATLTVAKVVAAQDGWITVHANTAANQPGDQLGHTMVKAGENDNVVVNLSPMPKAGDKVWPMLHIDAGVIGTYEFPGPDAPVIINGNIVMKQITLTAAMSTMTPSVEANDQPVGATLTVAKVVAAQDGWITVHANTAANQPGDQLGHTMVKAGENDNVVVNLSPMPKAGDKVWPMLHIDAGVIGTYEFPGPDAPVIINGNIVMKQITLTAAMSTVTPSVSANDQPTGSSITIAKVVAAQDGWITVHANTAANQPGAQLGHTMVKAGENDNVVVNLSPMPKAGDKVWPMLHIDAGVIGTYEFPGPDAPVIINGNIVMKEITLTGSSMTGGSTSNTSGSGTTVMPNMPVTGNSFDYTWLIVLAALALFGGFGVRKLARVRN